MSKVKSQTLQANSSARSGISRRSLVKAAGALPILAAGWPVQAEDKLFKIRAITAGISMAHIEDIDSIENAIGFLQRTRDRLRFSGYDVQTIRIATQPLAEYLPDWSSSRWIDRIETLDQIAVENGFTFNLGPVIVDNRYKSVFVDWAAEVISRTKNTNFTVHIASDTHGVHFESIRAASEAVLKIAQGSEGGVGNFRFSATAFCPPGTPYFPAAYHEGDAAFSIGMQSPRMLEEVFRNARDLSEASNMLASSMETAYLPIQELAEEISASEHRLYRGIDTSPAPGPGGASIGRAIEELSGVPFGDLGTMSACYAITSALQNLRVKSCGYSGLMLPPMEDPILASRLAEGRYNIPELLLYSSVCGTGLDVVPLPGDTSVEQVSKLMVEVASLAHRYRKPLAARLLPMPGKKAGDVVQFPKDPVLVDCPVMPLN